VEIAQAEQATELLYASIQYGSNPNAAYLGLYQSTDGGQHWTLLPSVGQVASNDGFSQTNYDLTLGVDPEVTVSGGSPSGQIYVGFQELWRSLDGGQTFDQTACTSGQTHWDIHVLTMSPKINRSGSVTPVYIGTDGGIFKSSDGGKTWTPLNGNIGSNLFFGIDIGKGAGKNAYTYGGCQDTGTAGHWPSDTDASWHAGIDGDGRLVAVDPSDPKTVYGFDDGFLYKTSDAGATWTYNGALPSATRGDPARAIALELNGTDPTQRVVYVGVGQILYQSADAGGTFNSVLNLGDNVDITTVATTKADSNRIWAGASDGSVYYSGDAGNNWNPGLSPNPSKGGAPVASIAVDANNPARVAVAYGGQSGIHSKYRTQRIFLTSDNGASWNDVSGTDGNGPQGNLPDLPLHSAVFDTSANPSALVVAGDAGVLRCSDVNVSGGTVTATWRAYGVGLPTVSCSSLAIDNSVNPPVLRVGTYGRSCFEVTRPTGPCIYVGPNLGFGAVPMGGKGGLSLDVYNCGDGPLTITGIATSDSPNFTLDPVPAFPIAIAPGKSQSFSVVFTPGSIGEDSATLQISSSDPASPYIRKATGRGVMARAPRLAANPTGQANFGLTSAASPRSIPLQLFNVGTKDLHISAISMASGSSDFSLDPVPVFPITIAPGAEVDVNIMYRPSTSGAPSASFRIVSDDSLGALSLDVAGMGG
jgi:photosystem II stability/assembly factor-like uncharacterized protein